MTFRARSAIVDSDPPEPEDDDDVDTTMVTPVEVIEPLRRHRSTCPDPSRDDHVGLQIPARSR